MSKEELDEGGNAIRVANLTFIEGILGQGAYGTVRLARRKRMILLVIIIMTPIIRQI
jgi:hypothetical protein